MPNLGEPRGKTSALWLRRSWPGNLSWKASWRARTSGRWSTLHSTWLCLRDDHFRRVALFLPAIGPDQPGQLDCWLARSKSQHNHFKKCNDRQRRKSTVSPNFVTRGLNWKIVEEFWATENLYNPPYGSTHWAIRRVIVMSLNNRTYS